jgi:hypothetical protein
MEVVTKSVITKSSDDTVASTPSVAPKYDYGCVMAYVNSSALDPIFKLVNHSDLYQESPEYMFDHVQSSAHITLLYGLHREVGYFDVKRKIYQALREIPIKSFQIAGLKVFSNPEKEYEVLVLEIKKDKFLERVNELLKELPNTNEYPDYTPHITIAYLKKGTAEKYLSSNISGFKSISSDMILFNSCDYEDMGESVVWFGTINKTAKGEKTIAQSKDELIPSNLDITKTKMEDTKTDPVVETTETETVVETQAEVETVETQPEVTAVTEEVVTETETVEEETKEVEEDEAQKSVKEMKDELSAVNEKIDALTKAFETITSALEPLTKSVEKINDLEKSANETKELVKSMPQIKKSLVAKTVEAEEKVEKTPANFKEALLQKAPVIS